MGGAERLQADGRLVTVTEWRPLAAGRLTDTKTLHVQHHAVHAGKTGLCDTHRTQIGCHRVFIDIFCLSLSFIASITHHDAESLEDVEFTHGAGAVFVQPWIHTHFMEDMSAERQK